MACQLYTQDDLTTLYGVVYGEILDRIKDPSLGKFDQKAYDDMIKKIYKELEEDPDNALIYAQAVPDIFNLVANDPEINRYLVYDVDFNFNYPKRQSLEFEDLEKVKAFLKPKAVRKSKKQVDKEIKTKNKSSKTIVQNNTNNQTGPWSEVQEQDKAKVDYPDKTFGQMKAAKNPKTMTEAERNEDDPEKELFYKVIKTLVWAARASRDGRVQLVQMDDTFDVGVDVMLKVQRLRDLDPSDLTSYDTKFLSGNRDIELLAAVVSDQDGNPIRFDEDGNIVEEGGRIVYQYIRPVIKDKGKLYLGNTSGYRYTLIPAVNLAKQEIAERLADGDVMDEAERKALLAKIKKDQKQKMNDLARLHDRFKEDTTPVLLPITGGSYGISEHKSAPLAETPFADAVDMIYLQESGYSYFIISKDVSGVAIDGRVYLQRMDITEDLARNIARILTTKALKDGEPLTAQERIDYYETFLSNRVQNNNMTVTVESILGEDTVVIDLYNPLTKEHYNPFDDPATAEDKIVEHLMHANKKTEELDYPASMSYMDDFAVDGVIQKGNRITDYEFVPNPKAPGGYTVKATSKDYFTFIKPFMKVDYASQDETAKYFVGINAYLSFAIPDEFSTPEDELSDIGAPPKIDLTDDKVDNGEPAKKKVTKKKTAKEEKATKIQYFQSTLSDSDLAKANVKESNVTFGLGVDFTTKDEKAAEVAAGRKKTWYGIKLGSKSGAPKNFMPSDETIDKIVKNLEEAAQVGGGNIVNIVGNDIAALKKSGYSQADIDKYVFNVLSKVAEKFKIEQVIGTGQTGVSEAAIKAAIKLGIPVKIRAHSGFRLRYPAPYLATGYKSQKNTKSDFMKRFLSKESKALQEVEALDKPVLEEEKVTMPEKPVVEEKTEQEQKVVDRKIAKTKLDDLLGDSTLFPEPTRNKRKAALMDQLYGSEKGWKEVQEWWKSSPLKDVVDLERLSLVINSDAYGKFMQAGSMLSDAANKLREKGFAARIELYGDALPVTLYHEAWHAFSQMVLSQQDRIQLYETARKYDKWKNLEYEDIEEELAEEFIDYAATGKKQTGFIQTIFDKIKKVIDFFFGKTTHRDVTRLQDIPMVKEYFDKLYTGKFTVSLENAENNLVGAFQVLNSSKRVIQPLKSEAKSFSPFTDVESDKVVNLIDSLMARQFYLFNSRWNTTSGATMLLSNSNTRKDLYTAVERQLRVLEQDAIEELEQIVQKNLTSDKPDVIGEQKLQSKVELLAKTLSNFGNIDLALAKKSKKGIVPFHMERSRFTVLRDQYKEEAEDATTAMFMSKEGNTYSAKDLASMDTMMMLSGIYELKKDVNGVYETQTDDEGVSTFVPVVDDFGVPVLESVDVMWSRLARLLQGSFDYPEVYDRISKAVETYPEFIQVLESLPNPHISAPGSYNNNTEFETETQFWQDFKKPVIPYIQFNINKTTVKKAVYADGKLISPKVVNYQSRVARANFDVYRILNDWQTNFSIADTTTNPYVTKIDGENYLDIDKLMAAVSVKRELAPDKANEFLRALGIALDMGSADIRNIVNNRQKPFVSSYNLEQIYNTMRLVYLAHKHEDPDLNAAAKKVLKKPLFYLLEGLPKKIQDAAGGKPTDVRSKIRTLAEMQNRFSDGYSNYSVLTPEKNKVWEQFLDNTLTRAITAINLAKNWQELTDSQADPNGRFQHMRWLAEENNPASQFSVILNSIFDMDPMSDTYGEKKPGAKLLLENIAGTQVINKDTNDSTGSSTASTDVTSKFLQELHTMLLSGVQEFMRHASKQTAMNMRASEVSTYPKKDSKSLYVDIMAFSPRNTSGNNNFGETQGFNIMLGYLSAEAGRIFRYKSNKDEFGNWAGYNRKVVRKDNKKEVDAGEAFTAFDDVITPANQKLLYDIIDKAIADKVSFADFNLKDLVNENVELRQKLKADVIEYFNLQSAENFARLEDAKYVDESLYAMVAADELSKDQINKMLIKAYTYNSWIHNFETIILAYGDMVQYNHDKEEFHKRNAGLGAGGRGFRADYRARAYINSPMFQRLYAEKEGYQVKAYDGTLTAAILDEVKISESKYLDEYRKIFIDAYIERYLNAGKSKKEAKTLAEKLADKVLKEYKNMKIGDGQGWVTFESYRMLKKLENSWSKQQEALYKRVVEGESVNAADIIEYFPPYKLQHYGHIKTTGLGLVSFHKFSLAPIIPSLATEDTQLGQLHRMLMEQGFDYALMPTGSKVGHIGSGDVILKDGKVDRTVKLTENIIYVENLKNQTQINSEYKGKSIFSTQLRKLVLEGLYENGEIISKDPAVRKLVQNYIDRVAAYTELLKNQLIDEIGFAKNADGEFVPVDKDSVGKLAKLIRDNLTRDDVISDDLIDIIDVTDDGQLRFDLSLHPEAAKIEKLLLSLVNKRIIKQKVKGEPLVQVSSALYDGLFELDFSKSKLERNAAIKKYMGSNFLPTYHRGADGKTTAMKVAIALQGDYEYLLNLDYQGEPIGNIDRLNEAIKDDEWLDANDGANRKAITMVGVRIPVQGLNSMEFMEIYHFLPPEAGNIIIPPAEIVAKSGADFDIDKLSIFMNNITPEGTVSTTMFENPEEFYEALKDPSKYDLTKDQMYAMQKAGFENKLIDDIRKILELPENYVSLITPNGTYLVKPIADRLAQHVMQYNPLANMMSDELNLSAKDDKGNQNTVISPTRVLEVGYNLYKHESNVVGKRTLGLGAIENTFNVIFNSLGFYMPAIYTHGEETVFGEADERVSFLGLRHHKMKAEGQEVISLSNQYDVDGINKVADIISQLINGWVDVEKDPWVFFVQGNYEVAPILLYLLKAGVPVTEAVYFVSQPLVREYVKEKRLAQSTYAEVLRRKPSTSVNYDAASRIISKYFPKPIESDKARYKVGEMLFEDFFENRKEKHFTESEMLKLIEESSERDIGKLWDEFYEKNKRAPIGPEIDNLIKQVSINADKVKSSRLSKTMFLHYLTIEQQIQGITEFKMASNPDTSLMTDVGQALDAKARWEKLVRQTKIPQVMRTKMRTDSILSSFFNYDLIEDLSKPLFRFRYDKDIQVAVSELINFQNSRELKAAFGNDYRDKVPVTFRNDILSYLFQNALRKYTLGDTYSSYILEQDANIQPVAGLDFGVQFVDTKKGPKMLVDNVQLEREYHQKAYLKGSEAKNSYEDRGLYPLSPGHFDSDSASSKDMYIRFVIEREYLRSIYSPEEIMKTDEFQAEYEKAVQEKIKDTAAKNKRYAYEKILAGKALDNTLNPYHLFKDKDNAYAIRLERLKLKYQDDFVKDYSVLSRLKLDSTNDRSMFSLYLDDKDLDTYKSTRYTADLRKLADRTVKKVDNEEENNAISDYFAKMTYVAMMQTGTNKSKFNFLNVTDFDKFLAIMDAEVAEFVTSPDKIGMLAQFEKKFFKENSVENHTKTRFKNYVVSKSEKTSEIPVMGENISSKGSEFAQKLTNPGNNLKIEYKGRTFRNAEHAYQTHKSGEFDEVAYKSKSFKPVGSKPADKATNYDTMVEILVAKLEQHPELINGIDQRGGLAYIKKSTHNVTGDKFWESKGENKFIQALGEAYSIVKSSAIELNQEDVENLVKRKNLLATSNPNVFVYNDLAGTQDSYKYIVENNPDITFVYGFSIAEMQFLAASTPEQFNKAKVSGQFLLRKVAGNSSVGLLVGQDKASDNFAKTDPKYYEGIKKIIENKIQEIHNAIAAGNKVAFSINGYGDPKSMPKEIFDYLSRRLFEEFQYLNPGSGILPSVAQEVAKYQPLTDAEILAKFEGDNNPLKC